MPGAVAGPLDGRLIPGGKSNLTFDVSDGVNHWIVRRPPLGHVLETAHDMAREHRVMSALNLTHVPVPQQFALCADPSFIGAPFMVMELVEGRPYRWAAELWPLGVQRTESICSSMISVLGDLHSIEPQSVGLGDFGRPEGFLTRQVRRWQQQLASSQARPIRGAAELSRLLDQRQPTSGPAAIVHGDFRLDNLLMDDSDDVAAIIDWEMSTVGDPLTDLALLCVYQRVAGLDGGSVVSDAGLAPGFPDVDEIVRQYVARSARDVSALGFYLALAFFKLAVVLEGIHVRHEHGETRGDGFDDVGKLGRAAHRARNHLDSGVDLMDFTFDARTTELQERLLAFMNEQVYPAEAVFSQQLADLPNPWAWTETAVMAKLRAEAKPRGLWNLFLPGEHGAGLTNLQYAPLAEISGRSLPLAPPAMNCAAPDTGNMEVLALFGTDAQKERWLRPLLDGDIRSSFAMTEPGVASSDATTIATSIVRDGDEYIINGTKCWITGAMNPGAQIFIVMGKTDPSADRHRQQSQILVERDTPGVVVTRGMHVFGYDDHDHGGHAEIEFHDVRVPVANLIATEGDGFAIAQARLGPGRVHHCMRSIGVAERAIELMCDRVSSRVAFGKPLAEQGVIRDWIAESRVRLEQLRLLVLRTAWLMDTVGNRGAHAEIQAIKIATPRTVEWILDKAIQSHGAAGLGQDFILASSFAHIRTLRLADGPDEVHKNALARAELKRHGARQGR